MELAQPIVDSRGLCNSGNIANLLVGSEYLVLSLYLGHGEFSYYLYRLFLRSTGGFAHSKLPYAECQRAGRMQRVPLSLLSSQISDETLRTRAQMVEVKSAAT